MNSAASLEMLEADARTLMRTFGPRVAAAQDENIAIRRCNRCNPPARVWTCYLCQFATEEKWRFDLHNRINPETCQRTARRWARAYSES